MFVGIPGSGKTTFAKNLAKELRAVVLNSDSERLYMWGNLETIQATHVNADERKAANKLTFGAMNYAANQVLAAGHSVIYDCNANHRWERQEKYDIAERNGANAIVARVQVPYEVSLHRVQDRESSHDSRKFFDHEKASSVLDRFSAEIEEPGDDERVVYINGEHSFEEQYEVLNQCIATLQ